MRHYAAVNGGMPAICFATKTCTDFWYKVAVSQQRLMTQGTHKKLAIVICDADMAMVHTTTTLHPVVCSNEHTTQSVGISCTIPTLKVSSNRGTVTCSSRSCDDFVVALSSQVLRSILVATVGWQKGNSLPGLHSHGIYVELLNKVSEALDCEQNVPIVA